MKTRSKHQRLTKRNLKNLRKTIAKKQRRHHSKTRKGGKIPNVYRQFQGVFNRATQSKKQRESDLAKIDQTTAKLAKIKEDSDFETLAMENDEELERPAEYERPSE